MLALHVRYLGAQKHLKVPLKPKLLTSRVARIKTANKLVTMQTDGSTERVIALNSKARRQRVMLTRGAVEVIRDHKAPLPSPQLRTLMLYYVTCEQK